MRFQPQREEPIPEEGASKRLFLFIVTLQNFWGRRSAAIIENILWFVTDTFMPRL
jgi:hypothetical protein